MENIKLHIEEKLWDSIKRNYIAENYTNAILDAIQFIGDLIREKSGLESDGNQLIGNALGGENPKIKLNNLITESDKNTQKGIESILRGIYSAYRNPRSHSKVQDTEIEAFEIIIFLNHLLKILDKSSGKFSSEIFFKRVLDEDFVRTKKYAELLIKDIPRNKYFEIAIGIFRTKENGKIHNLKLVWDNIYVKLTDEHKKELLDLASEELRYTDSFNIIIACISLFKSTWESIAEDARLRVENKLIKKLTIAEKYKSGSLNEAGKFCSWLPSIVKVSVLKDEIAEKIISVLKSKNESNQRFVIDYFQSYFDELESFLFLESFKDVIKQNLIDGNGTIYSFAIDQYKNDDEIKQLLESFVLVENYDDLPF